MIPGREIELQKEIVVYGGSDGITVKLTAMDPELVITLGQDIIKVISEPIAVLAGGQEKINESLPLAVKAFTMNMNPEITKKVMSQLMRHAYIGTKQVNSQMFSGNMRGYMEFMIESMKYQFGDFLTGLVDGLRQAMKQMN